MKTRIRLAKPDDQPKIEAIRNVNWKTHYSSLVGSKKVKTVLLRRKKQPREFRPNSKKQFSLVAVHDHQIVGFVTARQKNRFNWNMGSLYVRPSHSNHGIGSRLLINAFRRIRLKKAKRITTDTLQKNYSALGFFEFHGFKKNKKRVFRVFGVPFTVWQLEKKL